MKDRQEFPKENSSEDTKKDKDKDKDIDTEAETAGAETANEREASRKMERAVFEPREPSRQTSTDLPHGASSNGQSSDSPSEEPAGELESLPFPYISVCLLIAISIVFAAMLRVGHGDVAAAARLFGDKENSLIRAGQWWRLITPIFLHGGWGHIAANGLTLLMLGIPMERIYGARKFFLIYMLAGIAGNLSSFWFSPVPSLGASGALYGLMGAGLVFPLRFQARIDPSARKAILTQLARAALINLAINLIPNLNLDKWAHLGGMLGGGLAALVWMPDVLEDDRVPRWKNALLWTATITLLSLTIAAGVLQWQSVRHPQITVQTYYALDANDPWWGLLLPAGWRQAATVPSEGVEWAGPNQSELKIVDDLEHPGLRAETQAFLATHHAPLTPYAVDGKSGLKAMVRDAAQAVELHQVQTDGRTIEFIFTCPNAAYARMQPIFNTMMNTVRFVRPPLASPPVPVAP